MKEKVIEYKVKAPANEKEVGLRIKNIIPICELDGADMRRVGTSSCVQSDFYSYFYQCLTCKSIEITDREFGHTASGIDEPESKWERIY